MHAIRLGPFTIGLIALGFLATPAGLRGAQPAGAMWNNLKKVPLQDQLIVKMKSGRKVRGKLKVISDDSLTLVRRNESLDLERGKIRRIFRLLPGSGPNLGAMGLAAGFALGAVAAGFAGRTQGCCTGSYVAFIGGPMAAAGGLVGGAIGSRKARVLIYDAEIAKTLPPSNPKGTRPGRLESDNGNLSSKGVPHGN